MNDEKFLTYDEAMADPDPIISKINEETEKYLKKIDLFFNPQKIKTEKLTIQEAYHPLHYLPDEQRLEENLKEIERLKIENEKIRDEIIHLLNQSEKLEDEKDLIQDQIHKITRKRLKKKLKGKK